MKKPKNQERRKEICDRCGCDKHILVIHHWKIYAQCQQCGWEVEDISAKSKSCLDCRHLKEGWTGNGFNEPPDYDPECSKWDNLPDEAINSYAWELECPKHCDSFEAIASAGDMGKQNSAL